MSCMYRFTSCVHFVVSVSDSFDAAIGLDVTSVAIVVVYMLMYPRVTQVSSYLL